jgi:hypothetical protein
MAARTVAQQAADVQRWIRQANREGKVAKELTDAEYPSTIAEVYTALPPVQSCCQNIERTFETVCEYFRSYDTAIGNAGDEITDAEMNTYDNICDSYAELGRLIGTLKLLLERLKREVEITERQALEGSNLSAASSRPSLHASVMNMHSPNLLSAPQSPSPATHVQPPPSPQSVRMQFHTAQRPAAELFQGRFDQGEGSSQGSPFAPPARLVNPTPLNTQLLPAPTKEAGRASLPVPAPPTQPLMQQQNAAPGSAFYRFRTSTCVSSPPPSPSATALASFAQNLYRASPDVNLSVQDPSSTRLFEPIQPVPRFFRGAMEPASRGPAPFRAPFPPPFRPQAPLRFEAPSAQRPYADFHGIPPCQPHMFRPATDQGAHETPQQLDGSLTDMERLAKLVVDMMKSAPANTSAGPHRAMAKLPKLELGKFSGKYDEYRPFMDKFEQNVHENPQLSDAEKLSYLTSCLTDKAKLLVGNLAITNDNYRVALDSLRSAFGDPNIAIEDLNSKLYALKPVERGDFSSLKDFFYQMENIIRGLRALGSSAESEHMAGILMKKLPFGVVKSLEQLKGRSRIWSVDLLRDVLSEEIGYRESASRRASDKPSRDQRGAGHAKKQVTTTDAFVSSEHNDKRKNDRRGSGMQGNRYAGGFSRKPANPKQNIPPCAYCQEWHYSDECTKVTDLKDRVNSIKKSGRCFKCLKQGHGSSQCRSERRCFYCSKVGAHHSSICPQKANGRADDANVSVDDSTPPVRDLTESTETSTLAMDEKTVMKTAMVVVRNPDNPSEAIRVRVFFDTGTSRSYVTPRSAKRLKLVPKFEKHLLIRRFGNPKEPLLQITTKTAKLDLQALNGQIIRLSVEVSDNALQKMSKVSIGEDILQKLPDVPLADEPLPANTPVDVDVMIGNDYYDDLIGPGRIEIADGFRLVESDFGWILSGRLHDEKSNEDHPADLGNLILDTGCPPEENNRLCLDDLFKLDTIGIRDDPVSESDDQALEKFLKTVKFEEGRYQVCWPYKNVVIDLPTNYNIALRRLKSLINRCRMNGQSDFLTQYDEVMKGQLEKGITEIVADPQTPHRTHYLAHHGVVTPGRTTKLRIVFDASAKESRDKPSLNESMHRGQIFLDNIVSLLLRFRMHPVAILADIEKAFLQVGLQKSERDVTRFLWLNDVHQPPTGENLITLRFRRVSFGVVASPFLLGATLMYHLKKIGTPVALKTAENIYVDNVVTGANSPTEAIDYYHQTKRLFAEAGMNLREYASNDKAFMETLPQADRVDGQQVKVLGLCWDRAEDSLMLRVPEKMHSPPTKKSLLSDLFKVFDPLGFAVVVTIRGRMLLQKVTKLRTPWNAQLPADLIEECHSLFAEVRKLSSVRVPRFYGNHTGSEVRLMAFSDASKLAYAAVVYLQVKRDDGEWCSTLVFAKARVNPVKEMTVPRLELMGILIAVRAVEFIRSSLKLSGRTILWSDSQCALKWIDSNRVQGMFVENRLREIRRAKGIEYRYVPTKQNPADRASRGGTVDDIDDVWWNGPSWMSQREDEWPKNASELSSSEEQALDPAAIVLEPSQPVDAVPQRPDEPPFGIDPKRFSSYGLLLRVSVLCRRFVRRLKGESGVPTGYVTASELRAQSMSWIKYDQASNYSEALKALKSGKPFSIIKNLGLKMDENGIVRCHGRLANTMASYDAKFPILLGSKSWLTKLIIKDAHEMECHAGQAHTLTAIRRKFWIPRGRTRVKTEINQCLTCRRQEGKPFARPTMPDLPTERITRAEPFRNIGIDYFGPLYVRGCEGRQNPVVKRWCCLFTCLVTRAVHLEVAEDMTAGEFLMALKRFAGRRGTPRYIISDNAPHFKAVNKAKIFCSHLSENGITWKYITQYAPWSGGVYERMVRSVKSSLKKTVGRKLLTHRQLATVLIEVEHSVNSRPLTYVTDDLDSRNALTPNDLLGVPSKKQVAPTDEGDPTYEPGSTSTKDNLIKLNRHLETVANNFWKVWSNEYLLGLRAATRWNHADPKGSIKRSPASDELVLVKEPLLPRNRWSIAKIQQLLVGTDGQVRTARILFPDGKTTLRPVNLLCPLEANIVPQDQDRGSPEGENDPPAPSLCTSPKRPVRKAAALSRQRTKELLSDD